MPCNLPFSQIIGLVCTIYYNCMACHVMVRRENLFLPTNYIPKHHPLLLSTQILETKVSIPGPMGLNIYMYDQSHWSFFLCMGKMQPKVGSKVVLEEFKLCTYMYVIARRNILHTHTHTHTCIVAFSSLLTHLDQL